MLGTLDEGRLRNTSKVIVLFAMASLALIVSAQSVSATWTGYSCDGGGGCAPGSKYSRSRLEYAITGGSGNNTNWRFDTREYGGSNGYSGISQDSWRRQSASIWKSPDGQSWTFIDSTGSASSHNNDAPWADYVWTGTPISVTAQRGISFLVTIRHNSYYYCNPQQPWLGLCGPNTYDHSHEHSVFN